MKRGSLRSLVRLLHSTSINQSGPTTAPSCAFLLASLPRDSFCSALAFLRSSNAYPIGLLHVRSGRGGAVSRRRPGLALATGRVPVRSGRRRHVTQYGSHSLFNSIFVARQHDFCQGTTVAARRKDKVVNLLLRLPSPLRAHHDTSFGPNIKYVLTCIKNSHEPP